MAARKIGPINGTAARIDHATLLFADPGFCQIQAADNTPSTSHKPKSTRRLMSIKAGVNVRVHPRSRSQSNSVAVAR